MELIPHVLFYTAFLGLRRPILAASLGGAWTFCEFFHNPFLDFLDTDIMSIVRILYTLGYVTGDPKKVCITQAGRCNYYL